MTDFETEINTAIKGLTRRVNLKLEHIEIIENALANPDINDDIWNKYLNGNNTKMAFKEKIYSPEMIKLLTLRAIILPDTLPEFLTWLKEIKKDNLLTIYNNFQYDILKILTHEFRSTFIVEKIELGVILIIPHLFKDENLIEQVIGLLKTDKSLWGYDYINGISKEIDHDLKLMKKYAFLKEINDDFRIFNHKSWEGIKDELIIAWLLPPHSNRFRPIPKYQVWVRLFDGLNESKFALFFAHFAYDKVPTDIFSQVKKISFGSHYHYKIYDVNTTREVGFFEQFILELNQLLNIEIDMKLWKIIILVIVYGLGGFLLRAYSFPSKLEDSVNRFIKEETKSIVDKKQLKITKAEIKENIENTFDTKNSKLIKDVFKCYPNVEKCEVKYKSGEQIKIALSKFDETRASILKIKSELKLDDNTMQKKLREILKDSQLNYIEAIEQNNKKYQEDWVKAIYKYQLDNDLSQDGIINDIGITNILLKEDLAK